MKLAIFTGGEDISPAIYKHPRDNSTYFNSHRDAYELSAFQKLREFNIPLLGICRGAQLLCALAGGSLIQDVTGHGRFLNDNGQWEESPETVTSTHHQMQYPWDLPKDDYKLLAGSVAPISSHYIWNGKKYNTNDKIDENFAFEPDVVHYPKINALAIQYHPEWMNENSWGLNYARGLIGKLINGKL